MPGVAGVAFISWEPIPVVGSIQITKSSPKFVSGKGFTINSKNGPKPAHSYKLLSILTQMSWLLATVFLKLLMSVIAFC